MKTALLILFLASIIGVSAQTHSSSSAAIADIKVDKMPQYPGGNKALIRVLLDSVEEPGVRWEAANDDDVKIVMTFMVDERGGVSDAQVTKSTNKELNQKFIKAVKRLKFIPAMLDGKPVKVKYTLPFTVDFGDRTKY